MEAKQKRADQPTYKDLHPEEAHKWVRVYRAPPLINWGHPQAQLIREVLGKALCK